MISVTKIFRFEMGHAINDYDGMCRYIHGHSYVLHVTVGAKSENAVPLLPPGFVIDFKELKKIVGENIVNKLDHALVLSENYLKKHPKTPTDGQNLLIWPYEPSAENILFFIQHELLKSLSKKYKLIKLRLWETAESFAEWDNSFPDS